MTKVFDVVTIGDSILDTFLSLHSASDFARFDKETEELCIRSGAKVLIDSADFMLGGNASNVAVGLSRLGLSTALVAEIGDDEFSEKLVKGLTTEGVSLDFVKRTHDVPSTFSVILNLLGDRTAFIRHVERQHEIALDGLETKWLYLTSLGKEWHGLYEKVVAYKKTHDVKLAFNPGSAQIHEGPASFAEVLSLTDILFVNRDEAEVILHGKPITPEERDTDQNLLFRIQRMGPKMIVMTDGGNGAYVMDEKAELFHEAAMPNNPVDKTGAGDAFGTGFMGAYLLGKPVQESMQWGAANAASVIEHIGSEPGLLRPNEIEQRLQQYPEKVEEVKEELSSPSSL